MAAQAGLCLAWSETPEDTFCHVVAQINIEYNVMFLCIIISAYFLLQRERERERERERGGGRDGGRERERTTNCNVIRNRNERLLNTQGRREINLN